MKGGHPGTLICHSAMYFLVSPHPVLGELSGLPHVDMVCQIYVFLMKDVNCDDFLWSAKKSYVD